MWAGLWLARFFAFLWLCGGAPRERIWRDWFDKVLSALARQVMGIILCHAALRSTLPKPHGFDDPRKSHAISLRATYGSALRRAFKAKGFAERLAKIRRALENREALIARLVRRLRRGMTRMNSAHTRAPIGGDAASASTLCAAATANANTS